METKTVLRENWLTKNPPHRGGIVTWGLITLLIVSAFAYWNSWYQAADWMPASGQLVFKQHQWWRAWSALFAHADIPHLFGNLFLFFPFAYFLSSYFGTVFFPLIGFVIGGFTNLFVLLTMPAQVHLIGASGVVYWMGGAWLTLGFLVDRREKWGMRLLRAVAVALMLFAPQTYKPEISYLAHLVGFMGGIFSAFILYAFFRQRFLQAEVYEQKQDGEWPYGEIWKEGLPPGENNQRGSDGEFLQ